MWSHYSLSHRGFCVGFDRSHKLFKGEEESGGLRDVNYNRYRVKVPLKRGVAVDFEVMFRKSTDWKYEQEERMLVPLKSAKKIIDGDPYKIFLFEVPLDAVSKIIIGARASSRLQEQIMAFGSAHHVKVFRAVPSSSSYDMLRIEAVG